MPKQELILPDRRSSVIRVQVPTINTGGPIESAYTGWRAKQTSRAVDSLANLNRSEAGFTDTQTALVEAEVRRREVFAKLADLPEKLGHELAVRRLQRADVYRDAQHAYELNEVRRIKELTFAETELTQARTVLTDAEQQLRAQREHGYLNYELSHKKKSLELLDVELSAAERRAILRQHIAELDAPAGIGNDDLVDDALYAKRAELNASGLDTAQIDAAIERRKERSRGV